MQKSGREQDNERREVRGCAVTTAVVMCVCLVSRVLDPPASLCQQTVRKVKGHLHSVHPVYYIFFPFFSFPVWFLCFFLVCELSFFIYLSCLFPTVRFLFPFDHLTHTHTFSFSALKECKAFPLPPFSLFFPSLAQFLSQLFLLPCFFCFGLLIRNVRKCLLSATTQKHRK